MSDWTISSLSSEHDRGEFACGEASLDRFLKESARQNQDKDVSRTFVLTRKNESIILGYYTLAAGQIERFQLPPKLSKKLPKYPVPIAVLARLAVDESLKGQKMGRMLLWDALNRCLTASDSDTVGLGIYAVFVEAIDESAIDFYRHFGFEALVDTSDKLFLPLSMIRKARK
ncbi:MAG TPA: GNAT family N-acetyltransferase [Urbifossiella sp.]|nr:GNAT family N-acetyltransferase [Urbifossiella sp.]